MTSLDIPTHIANAIKRIAPEIDLLDIDQDEDLREECDLDSMDFLNLLADLKQQTSISIPESDYPKVRSYNQLLAYLRNHVE
ncbi:phosphopantetheine-binding protein [Photobacterium frigidiphilum]|uniref:Phosphopantetheine-binding protein n=1 Tax=Photobacterium frigidiphilum TaxID=264736 RepID=A0A2T3J5S0_9GAMM|nr:acyl carrier protein [Photobacterium frigidiphilum]PSU41677.1 phosphopantetheine-binding protein [Photobacterium frigidiphilum]